MKLIILFKTKTIYVKNLYLNYKFHIFLVILWFNMLPYRLYGITFMRVLLCLW